MTVFYKSFHYPYIYWISFSVYHFAMKRGVNMMAVIMLFLAGRVPFLGINPIAVALYILAYSGKRNKNKGMAAVVIGVISCAVLPMGMMSPADIVKYLLIFSCIIVIDRMAVRHRVYLNRIQLSLIGGILTACIGLAGGVFDIGGALVVSIGEGMLVIVLAQVLEKAVYLLSYSKNMESLTNEQVISVVLLLVIAIGGIYEPAPEHMSISESMLYLLILAMAGRYGASEGAIAGAGAGVLSGIRGGNMSLIGLFCLVGIFVGAVRKAGKWAGLITYVLSGLSLALLYPSELWNIAVLRSFVAAGAAYAFIPSSFFNVGDEKDEDSAENILTRYNLKTQTSYKLQEFANAFSKLSDSFSTDGTELAAVGGYNSETVFNEITSSVCRDCANCSTCWHSMYYDTYHETIGIIGACSGGKVNPSDIPANFALKCIRIDDFMREVNRQIELARVNMMWVNRFNQNRALMVRQMRDTAKLISELEKDVSGMARVSVDGEEEILAMLRAFGVRVKKIVSAKRRDGRCEIIIKMKVSGANCITYKEVADMISGVLGERWCVAEGFASTLSREYRTVSFVKDVKYRILTGVARTAKSGEEISGDNYSFIRLSGGRVIMTITDGMGSGVPAYEESEKVIELIEQFVQAGFREDIALRLVNSSMLLDGEKDGFSTVDICIIDLNKATCECMKYGAPSTYIRKKDTVKVIGSEEIPIGILPEITTSDSVHRLNTGDFVIMLSDGITDSFKDDPDEAVSSLIRSIETDNPQEMADRILSEALNCNMHRAGDDMSVLVAGIWKKNI